MNNSGENNQITIILMGILGVMIVILVVLVFVYLILRIREKTNKTKKIISDQNNNEVIRDKKAIQQEKAKHISTQLDKHSIDEFMEFEKIQDNMIIAKSKKKYLMVIECKGVNYDLMAGVEKIGVEEGFQQFLNTLRHPVQIYIQTRTINLENSINRYKNKLKVVDVDYKNKQYQYNQMRNSGKASKKQLEKAEFELTRQRNLLEYGRDIISNTEKMSQNKSVLNKNYYIIVPYFVEEVGSDKYYEEEINSIAFSELYTRSQSIIRTLSSCYVSGKILTSKELIELMYVAYNRDDSETLGVDKLLLSGYDDLYSTGIDVFEKKNRMLDEQIRKRAIEMANKSIEKVKTDIQKETEKKEESVEELARKMAAVILDKNRNGIGVGIARRAIEEVKKEGGEENG